MILNPQCSLTIVKKNAGGRLRRLYLVFTGEKTYLGYPITLVTENLDNGTDHYAHLLCYLTNNVPLPDGFNNQLIEFYSWKRVY